MSKNAVFPFQLKENTLNDLMFGDFMDPDLPPDMRTYKEVESIESFNKVAALCLEDYNQTHKTSMNLVIFRYTTLECLLSQLSELLYIFTF